MPELKAILLDMDGVVVDSEPIHEKAQRLIFQEFDLPVPDSEFSSFKGMTERKVFERIVADYGSEIHDVMKLVVAKEEAYRELLADLQPIPGAVDFIRRASGRYRLALTTSSVRDNQLFVFERFELGSFFEVIVTAEDIVHPKPHPQPYETTAELLGLEPEDCLVVEDSLHGVKSAREAGCRVAGMTTSFDAESLLHAGAHFTVDSYEELAAQISLGGDEVVPRGD